MPFQLLSHNNPSLSSLALVYSHVTPAYKA
uniref:Uncharacterized protein n=1 Tax=Rhizophora mucronata TaxID=61149 RepID=A0A2P2PIP1_RHIMU